MVIGSPHSIIWSYFSLLKNLSWHSDEVNSAKEKRENNLLVILMTITVVETFYNLFFSLLVSSDKYQIHKERILSDIRDTKYSFEKKLKEWPDVLFHKNVEFGKGIGQKFLTIKDKRNKLLHFLPEYKNLETSNLKLESEVDISIYEELDKFDAKSCPSLILDFVSELFIVANHPPERVGHLIHIWFGDLTKLRKTT